MVLMMVLLMTVLLMIVLMMIMKSFDFDFNERVAGYLSILLL